ncbi:hypothetical protein WOLCODRAFT_83851, partial [Wolfiporia cocos MD-104 SS10]
MDIQCPHCHALHWKGERLKSSTNTSHKFGVCCLQGQVDLPPIQLPPAALCWLFMGVDPRSRSFRDKIRQYNNAFAFTSVAVNVDNAILNGSGPYPFKIHGALYHKMGSLLPPEGLQPSYAQLYIHDPQAALDARNMRNHNLDLGIMPSEKPLLRVHHNPFVPLYHCAFEILQAKPPEEQINVRAHIMLQHTADRWHYNLPTTDEVAAVIPGSGDEDVQRHRDIILRLRGGNLEKISNIHPLYSPLHYVLLFP